VTDLLKSCPSSLTQPLLRQLLPYSRDGHCRASISRLITQHLAHSPINPEMLDLVVLLLEDDRSEVVLEGVAIVERMCEAGWGAAAKRACERGLEGLMRSGCREVCERV
jgi:hypothetical protein